MSLRSVLCAVLLVLAPFTFAAGAEGDPAELHKQGIEALKESQTKPDAIVAAARCFAKASALYDAKGQTEMAVEMNSFLYWCKKKMTLKDIDAFLKSEETTVAARLKEVEGKPVAASEAQAWLERADGFARTHAGEQFLIAVRYFEVAERFKDSDAGQAAMRKSLDAMQQVIAAQKPTAPANPPEKAKPGKTINLLPLIDPPKDTVAGKWGYSGGNLVCDKGGYARIEIPYQPPEEYDFRMVFMRVEGNTVVVQMASKAERQFMWAIDGYKSTTSGIDVLGGKEYNDNETTFKGHLITNNHWHTSIVQVRKTGVTVLFDGKPIVKLGAVYEKLKLKPVWKLRDSSLLGVGGHDVRLAFSTLEIVEVTGSGKKTR